MSKKVPELRGSLDCAGCWITKSRSVSKARSTKARRALDHEIVKCLEGTKHEGAKHEGQIREIAETGSVLEVGVQSDSIELDAAR